MTKAQTFHSIRRDALTTLQRLHLLACSFARIALVASVLLVAPVENLSARDVRAEIEKHNASIQETERERKYQAMSLTPFTFYRATAHLFYQDTVAANAIPALTASELDDPTDKGKAKAAQGFVRSQLSPEDKERKEKQDEFWEKETGGTKTRFNLTDKERFAEINIAIEKQIAAHWDEYIGSLKPGSASFRAGYFKPIHMAQRLGSGLGSLGVMKVYVLIEGEADTTKDDNVVLEAKATSAPAEVKTGALPAPQTTGGEAKRVSDATRAMTARTDDHEGWFNADGGSYHVTRISPLGDGVKLKDFEKREELEDYLQWSAVALANAHCRATPPFAGEALRAFRDFKEVKETIQKIGREYAVQVVEDYDAFRKK